MVELYVFDRHGGAESDELQIYGDGTQITRLKRVQALRLKRVQAADARRLRCGHIDTWR